MGCRVSHSNLDRVRFALGDTDTSDPILSDAEIEGCLEDRAELDTTGGTVFVNIPAAAADAAEAVAAKYARNFDFAEDGQRFQVSQRVGHYQALARELRSRQGGQSVSLGGTATTT